MRIWALLLCIVSVSVGASACSSDSDDMPAGQGGTSSGSGGNAGTVSGGVGGRSGPGGQAGAVGGMSGGTIAASGGSGGGGGEAPDASTDDAMTGMDAADDAGPQHQSLAQRVCPAGPFGASLPPEGQRTASLVPGAQDGFGFLEGPVWLAEQGVLLFSDMDFGSANVALGPPARIRRFTPPSSFDVFQENGNSNGLALDPDGDVLACTHDLQTISRYDAMTAVRDTMPLSYGGLHFNSPNDLTVRSDGTIYFTDPSHQLGPRSSETDQTSVYRVTPSGDVELVTTLNQPNGIALSLDEQTLYVASADPDILGFPVNEDGSVGDSEVFVAGAGGTDGMALDCAGNVYSTGSGKVQVWNADGDKLGEIAVPQGPSNVAFGAADRKTLFITAGSKLYSIELLVAGLPY